MGGSWLGTPPLYIWKGLANRECSASVVSAKVHATQAIHSPPLGKSPAVYRSCEPFSLRLFFLADHGVALEIVVGVRKDVAHLCAFALEIADVVGRILLDDFSGSA